MAGERGLKRKGNLPGKLLRISGRKCCYGLPPGTLTFHFDLPGAQGVHVVMARTGPRAPTRKQLDLREVSKKPGAFLHKLVGLETGGPQPKLTLVYYGVPRGHVTNQPTERTGVEHTAAQRILDRKQAPFVMQHQT